MDPKSLGEVPANITVAGYVPQAEAMNCDVILSHAGSGTTVAGLARGLPMVAIPMFVDQMHNAERLVCGRHRPARRPGPGPGRSDIHHPAGTGRPDVPSQCLVCRGRNRNPPYTGPSCPTDSHNGGRFNFPNHHG